MATLNIMASASTQEWDGEQRQSMPQASELLDRFRLDRGGVDRVHTHSLSMYYLSGNTGFTCTCGQSGLQVRYLSSPAWKSPMRNTNSRTISQLSSGSRTSCTQRSGGTMHVFSLKLRSTELN